MLGLWRSMSVMYSSHLTQSIVRFFLTTYITLTYDSGTDAAMARRLGEVIAPCPVAPGLVLAGRVH